MREVFDMKVNGQYIQCVFHRHRVLDDTCQMVIVVSASCLTYDILATSNDDILLCSMLYYINLTDIDGTYDGQEYTRSPLRQTYLYHLS